MSDDKKYLANELDALLVTNCYKLAKEARKKGEEYKCRCPQIREILKWDAKTIQSIIDSHPERRKDKNFIPIIT